MNEEFEIKVASEVGRLTGVIVHSPGQEIANMTPETAERALYSDILNLKVATSEYNQLLGVLQRTSKVMQILDLLCDVLADDRVRDGLVRRITEAEGVPYVADSLLTLSPEALSRVMIEGVPLRKTNLSRFLSEERYSLPPLHNFFFTRDSATSINNKVLISRMANRVRARETRIMEAIIDAHPLFSGRTVNPARLGGGGREITIEGGDILVARQDVLVVGMGARTTRQAIDFLIERFKGLGTGQHLVVQELPQTPESFIHLDMVFTLLDVDTCMVFEPVVMQTTRYDTVHIHIEGGQVAKIAKEDNLLTALAKLGIPLTPVFCGGRDDRWVQEREQWHSGANFFALAPGQIIGYGRNTATIEELVRAGYAVIPASDVISGKTALDETGKCVVTIDGSELARGGGGCRCMTMPVGRENL